MFEYIFVVRKILTIILALLWVLVMIYMGIRVILRSRY